MPTSSLAILVTPHLLEDLLHRPAHELLQAPLRHLIEELAHREHVLPRGAAVGGGLLDQPGREAGGAELDQEVAGVEGGLEGGGARRVEEL